MAKRHTPHADARPTVGGATLRRVRAARGLTLDAASVHCGIPKATLVAYETGNRRPADPSTRATLQAAFGVAPEWWDREPVPEAKPTPEPQPDPLDGAAVPVPPVDAGAAPPSPEGETGLAIAQAALGRARAAMVPGTLPADLARLIALEAQCAKTIAQLSGELDASELSAFKRTREFSHFVALVAEALKPFPSAWKALTRAIGMSRCEIPMGDSGEDEGIVAAPTPPELDSLRLSCDRLDEWMASREKWDAIIGYEAADRLIYPSAGHERWLSVADVLLLRRVVDCLDRSLPHLERSALAYEPQLAYYRLVLLRLSRESERGGRIAAFQRDYGPLVTEKAKEAFA